MAATIPPGCRLIVQAISAMATIPAASTTKRGAAAMKALTDWARR